MISLATLVFMNDETREGDSYQSNILMLSHNIFPAQNTQEVNILNNNHYAKYGLYNWNIDGPKIIVYWWIQ